MANEGSRIGDLFMKKMMLVYGALLLAFLTYVFMYRLEDKRSSAWEEGGLHGGMGELCHGDFSIRHGILEKYSEGLRGWRDALGVTVDYRGSTQYDVEEQITVLEQVITKAFRYRLVGHRFQSADVDD